MIEPNDVAPNNAYRLSEIVGCGDRSEFFLFQGSTKYHCCPTNVFLLLRKSVLRKALLVEKLLLNMKSRRRTFLLLLGEGQDEGINDIKVLHCINPLTPTQCCRAIPALHSSSALRATKSAPGRFVPKGEGVCGTAVIRGLLGTIFSRHIDSVLTNPFVQRGS